MKDFKEKVDLIKDNPNKLIPVSEEFAEYFLGCVPPVRFNGNRFLNGEPYTHNKRGEAVYYGFGFAHGQWVGTMSTVKEYEQMLNKEML